jgi:hypothetical protein
MCEMIDVYAHVGCRVPSSFWLFFCVMVFVGLVGQWAGVATNRPILVELVPVG